MTEYRQGHIKHNPDTNEVALRTVFGEENPQMARLAWLIATPSMGARNAHTADVEAWADLFVPEQPAGGS